MNVHHLELFYYVAKHGGISEAVRNIPYGIQQPAVSGQIIQLEEFLGVTLFQRRPFALTVAGEELFKFIEPFFGNLDAVATHLQGGVAHQIRIGASELILRDHLPEIVRIVRKKFPKLKIALRESNQPQLEAWLEHGELDLVLTLVRGDAPVGVHCQPLIKLQLILLVPKESKIKSADELWKRDRIDEPLIALPLNELICRHFQETLQRKGVEWFPSVEVSSLNLIQAYVEQGYGIGLSIRMPGVEVSNKVRVLELSDFLPLTAGVLWRGKATALITAFLDEMQKRAQQVQGSMGS